MSVSLCKVVVSMLSAAVGALWVAYRKARDAHIADLREATRKAEEARAELERLNAELNARLSQSPPRIQV